MSNALIAPAAPASSYCPSTDRPTATFPTADHLARLEHEEAAHRERLADLWADRTPTELLPVVGRPAHRRPGRAAYSRRTAPTGTKVSHLRAALAGILIAAAILIPMQLFAAQGISSARQAALEQSAQRDAAQAEQAAPAPAAHSDVRTDIQADWVTEGTGAAYDHTDPAASPLDLPACTTSPDTPLPCLATISHDSRRAVVLEEDASLTALVRR